MNYNPKAKSKQSLCKYQSNNPIGNSHDNYQGTVYKVSFTLQNNLNSGDVILNYWPLDSYTTLLDNEISPTPTFINRESGCHISNMNNSTGDVWGTVIHLTQDGNGNPIDYWYPQLQVN